MDESGAEVFTTLLPSGTPLPARRHHVLSGRGTLSSLSVDVYQRSLPRPPEKLAKVGKCVPRPAAAAAAASVNRERDALCPCATSRSC